LGLSQNPKPPNPQSPIPNPQSPIFKKNENNYFKKKFKIKKLRRKSNLMKLLKIENTSKKRTNIPLKLSKIKSSYTLSALFLNQMENFQRRNKNYLKKILNNKKTISYSKSRQINDIQISDIYKANKTIYKLYGNNPNLNSNKNTKVDSQNVFQYFKNINLENKKKPSNSVKEQRKKIRTEMNSKKHTKDKDINCLKLSSSNTNSTSINTNNTNNFNSRSTKNIVNINIEPLMKENKKLKNNIDDIEKENKGLIKKLNKLRDKNLELGNVLYALRKENEEFNISINQFMKLLNVLKKCGIKLSHIMENMSDSEEEDEYEYDMEENKTEFYFNKDKGNYSFEKKNIANYRIKKMKDGIKEDKDVSGTNISFGRLECHEEFGNKKLNVDSKKIPKLDIDKIKKDDFE